MTADCLFVVGGGADEDDVLLGSDEASAEMNDYTLHVWRTDFRPVAKQLLERIDAHQSDFETLDQPSSS